MPEDLRTSDPVGDCRDNFQPPTSKTQLTSSWFLVVGSWKLTPTLFPCGLSPWRRRERLDRYLLVANLEDFQFLGSTRRPKDHCVALAGLHQRVGERRHPADIAAIQVQFVRADNTNFAFGAGFVRQAHGCTEENLRCRAAGSWCRGIDDLGSVDAPSEEANPPVDLAEPLLTVVVVRVFAAIAIAGRPGDHLGDGRAFPGEEKLELGSQPLEASRRDVVLGRRSRWGGCFRSRLVLLVRFDVVDVVHIPAWSVRRALTPRPCAMHICVAHIARVRSTSGQGKANRTFSAVAARRVRCSAEPRRR